MCSCSGSCNCNSTTIPKGPQGNPGTPGVQGPVGPVSTVPGPPGEDGVDGINGKNAFTTLTDDFVQPAINSNINIPVVDSTWVAIDSIIFIESNNLVDAGGYYRVINVNSLTSILIKNLGWTIPGVSIVPPGYAAGGNGTLVVAAGTIGATGNTGLSGINGTSITEVQNQGSLVTAITGTYTLTTVVTDASQICTSNGDMAKFVFIIDTFSSSPPAGPDKPYFEFDINTVTASIRAGSLANDEITLDVTSSPSCATIEFTVKRLSVTTAVCFVKAYLDNVSSTKSIVNYVGDVSINPITIDFSASNTFSVKITLPQSMSYSLVSSWVEQYKS
jgi:hypothetical protein